MGIIGILDTYLDCALKYYMGPLGVVNDIFFPVGAQRVLSMVRVAGTAGAVTAESKKSVKHVTTPTV